MKNGNVKLTIIVPVFNAEKYLKRCIESFIHQIDDQTEVILIDDGSTDMSGEICDEYSQKYDYVSTIHQENCGVSATRNAGIKFSLGEWITFIDSDDIMCNDFYKTVQAHIRDNHDVLMFGITSIDDQRALIVKNEGNEIEFTNKNRDLLIKNCFLSKTDAFGGAIGIRSPNGSLFRRKFLSENNLLFDIEVGLGEDMLFMLRVFERMSALKYVPKIIYGHYYHNEGSITNQYKPDMEKTISEYEKIMAFWLDRNIKYMPYYANYRLNDIIIYLKGYLFNKKNSESEKIKRQNMKRVLSGYKKYFKLANDSGLIKNYPIKKRFVFILAIYNAYVPIKIIFLLKYN